MDSYEMDQAVRDNEINMRKGMENLAKQLEDMETQHRADKAEIQEMLEMELKIKENRKEKTAAMENNTQLRIQKLNSFLVSVQSDIAKTLDVKRLEQEGINLKDLIALYHLVEQKLDAARSKNDALVAEEALIQQKIGGLNKELQEMQCNPRKRKNPGASDHQS